MNENNKDLSLLDLISKSSLFVTVMDVETNEPSYFGSGFLATYLGRYFFITADHVIQVENKKTYALISKGNPAKNGQTEFYQTGPLIYFRKGSIKNFEIIDFEKIEEFANEQVDITFAEIQEEDINFFQAGFYFNGIEITSGNKEVLNLDPKTSISAEDYFGFYGHIKPDVFGPIIRAESKFFLNLQYKGEFNSFLLFNSEYMIQSQSEYAGASGAPILNSLGQVVGVVSSVNENSHSIFAFPIQHCKDLIQASLVTGILQ